MWDLVISHCFPKIRKVQKWVLVVNAKKVAHAVILLAAIFFSFCSFSHFSTSAWTHSKTNNPESLPQQLLLFIGSWYMKKRLSWLKKATAEASLDLQTFVTSGVSSLTLSCLTKTSPYLKQHPSVLDENNDRLPFCSTQSIWILSLLHPLLFMVNSLNNSWAMGIYKLINCLLGATKMPRTQPSAR